MGRYSFAESAETGYRNKFSVGIKTCLCFFYKISFINKHSGIFCFNQLDKTVIVTGIKNSTNDFNLPELGSNTGSILSQHLNYIRDMQQNLPQVNFPKTSQTRISSIMLKTIIFFASNAQNKVHMEFNKRIR